MIPSATYRFQFNKNFRFTDAEGLVDYLATLGISHVYSSPLLKARAGSLHGYDVVDPSLINPELGSEEDFRRFVAKLREHGMGLVLDIVPNHMAADVQNPWWHDVLMHGSASRFAGYFDIDWEAAGGKVRLPYLSESLDEAVAADKVRVVDRHTLQVGDATLPLAPGSRMGAVSEVLARQNYILEESFACQRHINYRRFFDVCELVSLRQDNLEVFEAVHAVPLRTDCGSTTSTGSGTRQLIWHNLGAAAATKCISW
jgi:maltooligosyltrehalose synthase